jgi:tetratricopeptide (TPR) repeat protein
MHNPIRKPYVLVIILFFITVTFSLPALAQNRIIRGKVINDKGEPVKDAQIFIQGTDIRREYTIKTDDEGDYFYMGIPRGVYNVIVRAKGYAPDFEQNVRPPLGDEVVVDFELVPGDETQKLPIEMTEEEIEKLREDIKKAEARRAASEEVKADFEQALELAKQGNYEEAVVGFQAALEKDPEQAYIQANLADALAKLDRNEEALAAYRKAIALKADDAAMYTNMGVLLGKMGRTEESTAAFKQAADLNPESAAQNFYNLGATLVNEGRTEEAVAAFRQAIAADENYAEAYFQLGICLSGNPETMAEAVDHLKKYIEMGQNPEQVEVAKQLISALQP